MPAPNVQGTVAVSLRTFQARLASPGAAGASLAGLTCIQGFTSDAGEVILVGERNRRQPAIETDCLAIALRNAYSISTDYEGIPGCTIDPRVGDDPWLVQDVHVFGMPHSCAMSSRFVALDYEVKQTGVGTGPSELGVRSAFDIQRPLCSGSS
jgi:hypothetical protein